LTLSVAVGMNTVLMWTQFVIASGYKVTDLGTLGGHFSAAYGINASGSVVGGSTIGGDPDAHVYLWTPLVPNGSVGSIDVLMASGYGYSINESGRVTGQRNATNHAFIYDGSIHDLGALAGPHSLGYDVNASGQVTGESTYPGGGDGGLHAFVWTPTTPGGP